LKYLIEIIITAILLNFIACNGSKQSLVSKIQSDSIGHGYYVSFDEKRMVVINSEKDYKQLWDDVYANLDQLPKIPEVDLKKYTVVAVFMGAQKSGGFDIKIDKVTSMNDKLFIDVTDITPGVNCMVTDAITKPYDVVKIAKTDLEYEFRVNKVTKDCRQ
jgi:protease stability complex PrcB-like protein